MRRPWPAALAVVLGVLAAPAVAGAAPEPGTGAHGRSFSGTAPDGTVLGFADDH